MFTHIKLNHYLEKSSLHGNTEILTTGLVIYAKKWY